MKIRLAVIGDFGADVPDEAKVAALVRSWAPDHVLTVGDDNYPSGSAATIDANVGKHYNQFIGNYRGKHGAAAPRIASGPRRAITTGWRRG